MKDYLKKILYLVGDDVKKLPWMLLLFVSISVFEIAGLGLIVPYISLIISPDTVLDSYVYILISDIFDDKSIESLLIVFGCMLIVIFIIKATLSILINQKILKIVNRTYLFKL